MPCCCYDSSWIDWNWQLSTCACLVTNTFEFEIGYRTSERPCLPPVSDFMAKADNSSFSSETSQKLVTWDPIQRFLSNVSIRRLVTFRNVGRSAARKLILSPAFPKSGQVWMSAVRWHALSTDLRLHLLIELNGWSESVPRAEMMVREYKMEAMTVVSLGRILMPRLWPMDSRSQTGSFLERRTKYSFACASRSLISST